MLTKLPLINLILKIYALISNPYVAESQPFEIMRHTPCGCPGWSSHGMGAPLTKLKRIPRQPPLDTHRTPVLPSPYPVRRQPGAAPCRSATKTGRTSLPTPNSRIEPSPSRVLEVTRWHKPSERSATKCHKMSYIVALGKPLLATSPAFTMKRPCMKPFPILKSSRLKYDSSRHNPIMRLQS